MAKKRYPKRRLRTPKERARKFVTEIKTGYVVNQKGNGFAEKNGQKIALTDEMKAFRSGYLTAQQDSARLYNWKKKKGYL